MHHGRARTRVRRAVAHALALLAGGVVIGLGGCARVCVAGVMIIAARG
jgi:hypothetical protein